ncbi:hypothetical protein ON010_g13988 [Phytophthora cinnamomi]|nr:hypothetical protein ON010_g13988 [Phytophthora cinnamomi]
MAPSSWHVEAHDPRAETDLVPPRRPLRGPRRGRPHAAARLPRRLRRGALAAGVRAQPELRHLLPGHAGRHRVRVPAHPAHFPELALVPHEPQPIGAHGAADGAAGVRVLRAQQPQDRRARQVLPLHPDRHLLRAVREVRRGAREPHQAALTTVAMTADALLVVGAYDKIDCHHITWMAMSVTGVVLTVSVGSRLRHTWPSGSRGDQFYRDKAAQEIPGFRRADRAGAVAPPALGSPDRKKRECDSMFFDENGGLMEQSVRLAISIGTYLVPNWGALYVFYVLPRFQFSTVLDVPGLVMDDEHEEATYELLPADEYVSPRPSGGSSRVVASSATAKEPAAINPDHIAQQCEPRSEQLGP